MVPAPVTVVTTVVTTAAGVPDAVAVCYSLLNLKTAQKGFVAAMGPK